MQETILLNTADNTREISLIDSLKHLLDYCFEGGSGVCVCAMHNVIMHRFHTNRQKHMTIKRWTTKALKFIQSHREADCLNTLCRDAMSHDLLLCVFLFCFIRFGFSIDAHAVVFQSNVFWIPNYD